MEWLISLFIGIYIIQLYSVVLRFYTEDFVTKKEVVVALIPFSWGFSLIRFTLKQYKALK